MKKHKLFLIFLLCSTFTILLSLNPETYGAEYHVDNITQANSAAKNAGDIVYIKGGKYSQQLRPNISGSTSKGYITYRPEPGSTITITGVKLGINLNDRSYIHIYGLRIINVGLGQYSGGWIDISGGANNIIIENCEMDEAGGAWSGITISDAHHVKLLNNTISGNCPCTSRCIGENRGGPHDLIFLSNSHHNLFEGNSLFNGIHDNIDIQDKGEGKTTYNIIRGNYLYNKWHANMDIWSPEYMLVENNTVYDAGEKHSTNYCTRSLKDIDADRWRHKGVQVNNRYSIVRNNVVVNNGTALEVTSASSDTKYLWKDNAVSNRLYHNTVVSNQYGIYKNSADPSVNNIYKNNIFYKNVTDVRISDGTSSPSTNQYINNNMYGSQETSQYSSKDVKQGNISKAPQFENEAKRNYNLKSGSPMIDKGAWLTTTSSAGSGNTVQVEDARYFMDGWGLIKGDLIQFENQSKTYRVTNVNYNNGTITINSSNASWSKGLGIGLPYKSNRPDLGAFEYGGSAPSPLSITTTSLSGAEVDNPYSATLVAAGGTPPYTWSRTSGNVPSGITVNSNGTITGTGTPSAIGQFSFTVEVKDASGATDSEQLTLTVLSAGLENLVNGDTYTGHSPQLSSTLTVDHLWDGDYSNGEGTSTGGEAITSFQVDYDLGKVYDISLIRFYGDKEGKWVSRHYSVLVKENEGDNYTTFIDHANAFTNEPIITAPTDLSARYIRLIVFNEEDYLSVQACEFEVFGVPTDNPPMVGVPKNLKVTKVSQP